MTYDRSDESLLMGRVGGVANPFIEARPMRSIGRGWNLFANGAEVSAEEVQHRPQPPVDRGSRPTSNPRWVVLAFAVTAVSAAIPIVLHGLRVDPVAQGRPDAVPAVGAPPPQSAPLGRSGKLSLGGDGAEDIAFGTMNYGEAGNRVLTLKNAGAGELRLKKGTTSCGCTVAGFGDGEALRPEAVLKPGEAAHLTLRWTPKRPGAFQSRATILTSDPDRAQVEFRIHGEALAAITTVPAGGAVRIADLASDETGRATLTLSSPDRPEFRILEVRSSRPELLNTTYRAVTAAEPSADGSKSGYEIAITLRPESRLGPFREELVVTTDHPRKPELRVPVTGERVGAISFLPRQVRIAAGAPTGGRGLAILSVRGQDATHFQVAEAPRGLDVVIEPADADVAGPIHRYRLTASVAPGAPPGRVAGDIVLKTDHPAMGVVNVPVSVVVRDGKQAGGTGIDGHMPQEP